MGDSKGQFVLDFSTATRKHDPETSKKAEKKITASGGRKTHCQIILGCLRQHNGATSKELSEYLFGILRHDQIWRRRTDMVENKKIKIQGQKDGFDQWWII